MFSALFFNKKKLSIMYTFLSLFSDFVGFLNAAFKDV
jgi:hypothetical protein